MSAPSPLRVFWQSSEDSVFSAISCPTFCSASVHIPAALAGVRLSAEEKLRAALPREERRNLLFVVIVWRFFCQVFELGQIIEERDRLIADLKATLSADKQTHDWQQRRSAFEHHHSHTTTDLSCQNGVCTRLRMSSYFPPVSSAFSDCLFCWTVWSCRFFAAVLLFTVLFLMFAGFLYLNSCICDLLLVDRTLSPSKRPNVFEAMYTVSHSQNEPTL